MENIIHSKFSEVVKLDECKFWTTRSAMKIEKKQQLIDFQPKLIGWRLISFWKVMESNLKVFYV